MSRNVEFIERVDSNQSNYSSNLTSSVGANVDYVFKCIVIGNSATGKSSLVTRFTDDKFLERGLTIGVEYGSKIITTQTNKKIKLQIWDTAGQEQFKSIARSYYRNTTICLLVYDITNVQSFYAIEKWFDDVSTVSNKPLMILIGNKHDLREERQVSIAMGARFAHANNMLFLETSAKTATNVEEIFDLCSRRVIDLIEQEILEPVPTNGIILGQGTETSQAEKTFFDKCCKF